MKRPERVMIVHPGPEFSVHDVFEGWMEAFSDLGIRTIDYNLQDRLAFYEHLYLWTGNTDEHAHREFRKALPDRKTVVALASNGIFSTMLQFWPQLIIIISVFFIPMEYIEILRDRGAKVVFLFTESPYEEVKQLERAQHADLVLLNDPIKLPDYDAAGIPAAYMPHAYRPRRHYPGPFPDDMATDFAFVGTAFPSRVEFLERMHAAGAFDGIDVTLAGGGWHLEAKQGSPVRDLISHDPEAGIQNSLTTQIYQAARMGLNLYRWAKGDTFHEGIALGPREVEMAACGLPFLRDPRPEGDELFPMLPTFASPEDAAEQLQWWLAHESEREELGRLARKAVRPRTFTANAERLLKLLEAL